MRVMAFGTFDVIHLGHVYYLEHAKALVGSRGKLVVVVSRDSSVKRFKKKKAYFNENERVQMVSSLKPVDKAVLGGKGNWFEVVAKYKPEIVVLGYDQKVDEKELQKFLSEKGVNPKIVRFTKAFQPSKHKSSLIKKNGAVRVSKR